MSLLWTSLIALTLLLGFTSGDQWLMVGDFMTDELVQERNLEVESTNSTTSVTSSLRISFTTPKRHTINCVLAAALNMNGDVSVVDGGPGYSNVTLAYRSVRLGRPDLFFVLVESYAPREAEPEVVEVKDEPYERIRIERTRK